MRNKRKSALSLLVLMLSLSGCTQGHSKVVRPIIINYPQESQSRAKEEIESGVCSELSLYMRDYLLMRDESRVLDGS